MTGPEDSESVPLSTKDAVKFWLDGTLRLRVCRYCLKTASKLSDLNEIFELGVNGGLYEITLKDMVASFYPFKVDSTVDFPNKICGECLNLAISAYLFTQQCERAERALRNCFEDINEKFEKLDPLEPVKKRGKKKLNPNSNLLFAEHNNVIDYADPIINIINTNSIILDATEVNALECQKCWQLLPNPHSLINHEHIHPKSMWYNCKQCGKSFVKRYHLKQHLKKVHKLGPLEPQEIPTGFNCNQCGQFNTDLAVHYQHIERHKFKTVLQHLFKNKLDRLCTLCLENATCMTNVNEVINLHGGYPGLVGEQSIYDMISTIFPNQLVNKHQDIFIEEANRKRKFMFPSLKKTVLCIQNSNILITTKLNISLNIERKIDIDLSKAIDRNKLVSLNINKKNCDDVNIKKNETLCKMCWIFKMPCNCEENIGYRTGLNDKYSWLFSKISFNSARMKICESCLNYTISTYIFTLKVDFVKNRLNTCVTHLLYNLDSLKDTEKTIMIEISKDIILPIVKFKNILEIDENLSIDESEFQIEVLEDEFREDFALSDSENKSETFFHSPPPKLDKVNNTGKEDLFKDDFTNVSDTESENENPAKNVTKTYTRKFINGYKKLNKYKMNNVCSEFLKFKKNTVSHKKFINPTFTCPFCNKYFISDYFIKKHVLKHVHKKSKCSKCFKQFPSQFHLNEHIKMDHILNKNSYSSCVMCGRTFSSLTKLKSHQKSHQSKQCHLCDKYFISQKHYNSHFQRHAAKFKQYINKDRQTCSFCEKACSNENELSLHVNKVHLQMKPYNCDMCEKNYYTEYNLSGHKLLHSLRSKETCTFCKKTLMCRKDLVVHVRKHIGIKPHQCPVCRLSFYSDSQMRKHMKTFHGGRFWCRLCKAVVKTNSILKTHISVVHSAL